MSKLFILMLFGSLLAIPGAAQTGQQSGAGPANPLSTWLRNAYMGNRNTIVRSAEKMPEENYGMRPGTQLEVRTFGQQVGHVANYKFSVVFAGQGRKESQCRK